MYLLQQKLLLCFVFLNITNMFVFIWISKFLLIRLFNNRKYFLDLLEIDSIINFILTYIFLFFTSIKTFSNSESNFRTSIGDFE